VDDAVEQTKRVGPRGAAGFVNAILRKAAANRGQPPPADGGSAALQAEQLYSIPKDVFAKLAKLYGEADALAMSAGFNREPPTLARLIGETKIDALGTPALPHAAAGVVVLAEARRDTLAALADANLAQVQDATSVATIDALDVRPGQRVLDRCSGRGTKTRQILERVGPAGHVVAMDTSLDRLASLRATLKPAIAAGMLRVVAAGEVAMLGDDQRPFDRVLIDAPCSNSGVLARRPEARYRQTPRDLREVATLQSTILADTADVVAPGGLLVYATCSIWPDENEATVERFLSRDGRFELLGQRSIAPAPAVDPTQYHDGGFTATLRRK
jgi:16S rRNA (cytosine967-C5)-methyltransferase